MQCFTVTYPFVGFLSLCSCVYKLVVAFSAFGLSSFCLGWWKGAVISHSLELCCFEVKGTEDTFLLL